MGILDFYENFRETKSKVEKIKTKERNYNFEDGFSGDRKKDMKTTNQKKNKKEGNDSRDER